MEEDNLYKIFDSITCESASEYFNDNLNLDAIQTIASEFYESVSLNKTSHILAFLLLYKKLVRDSEGILSQDEHYCFFEKPLIELSK